MVRDEKGAVSTPSLFFPAAADGGGTDGRTRGLFYTSICPSGSRSMDGKDMLLLTFLYPSCKRSLIAPPVISSLNFC